MSKTIEIPETKIRQAIWMLKIDKTKNQFVNIWELLIIQKD